MTSKNIWYISKYIVPPEVDRVGGRGFMIMRELLHLGHKCTIITSDSNTFIKDPGLTSGYLLREIDGIVFCWVRTLKSSASKSLRRIMSWLDFEFRLLRLPLSNFNPPDAIIVSSLSLFTILNGLRLRRRFSCRLVFEIRDIWPLTLTEEGGFSPRNPIVKALGWIERLGYRKADAIVGTMPNLSKHVEEVLGYPRPVHCIPMGIDPDLINESEPLPDDYIKTHFPPGRFTVAHVGSIGITNALDTFLQCAAQMTKFQDIRFLLVGSGDLRDHYIQKYGQLSNLTFAPVVPQRQVQALLRHCDLLYFATYPSKVWHFGQSLNKVIDYMLSGKPIVASYSGFPSMINEAGCGVFVPAGDLPALAHEIHRFANLSEFERTAIGANGRRWILAHRSYRNLATAYHDLIFTQDSRPPKSHSKSGKQGSSKTF